MTSTFQHMDGGRSLGTYTEHKDGSRAGESAGSKSKRKLGLEKKFKTVVGF